MNIVEAVKEMTQGKKFRRECWTGTMYIQIADSGRGIYLVGSSGDTYILNVSDLEATDWVPTQTQQEKDLETVGKGKSILKYCSSDGITTIPIRLLSELVDRMESLCKQ